MKRINAHNMNKMNLMLLRMIKNSKGQFIAVLVIIITGIAVFSALGMTSQNMYSSLYDYYNGNNFADLFVETDLVSKQRIESLPVIEGIEDAQGRIGFNGQMVTEDDRERVNLRMVSTTYDGKELNKCTLLEGGKIEKGSKDVWVLKQFADGRNIKIGDMIKVQANGVQYKLDVVGIVANPEYIYLMQSAEEMLPNPSKYGVLYMGIECARQMSGIRDGYNEITIRYEGESFSDLAVAAGKKGVLNTGIDETGLIDDLKEVLKSSSVRSITKRENQLSNNMLKSELQQLEKMANSLPIVFLIVAGLVLMMMLGRMVKRDRIKIGVLKATGFTNRQVLVHYVKYAAIAGAIGGTLGAISGMLMSGAMTKLYLEFFNIPLMRVEFYMRYVLMALIYSIIFCSVSGLLGARESMNITPTEAMRDEAPKIGKRILLEKFPTFWRKLSFSQKMVWKNIFRNKKRTIFVLSGVTLTYAMMLFTASMQGTIDQIINKDFDKFQTMDYNISFARPVKVSSVYDLKHVINLEYMEPKMEFAYELAKGNKNQGVMVIGILPDTKFYNFENAKGDSISRPTTGIYLTENLAKELDAQKGDIIQVKNYLPGKKDVYVNVEEIVRQSLGMSAYMNMEQMGRLLFEKNIATGAYVNSRDGDINKETSTLTNISSIMSKEESRNAYLEYMTMMNASIVIMVFFSGILGFCIVYNATIISIGERKMEFSSLRVLGMGKNEIFRMILQENNIIMLIGIILGIPLGKLMTYYSSAAFSTTLYCIKIEPNFVAYFSATIFTVICIVVAELATYRKIRKLDFLQALKNRAS